MDKILETLSEIEWAVGVQINSPKILINVYIIMNDAHVPVVGMRLQQYIQQYELNIIARRGHIAIGGSDSQLRLFLNELISLNEQLHGRHDNKVNISPLGVYHPSLGTWS